MTLKYQQSSQLLVNPRLQIVLWVNHSGLNALSSEFFCPKECLGNLKFPGWFGLSSMMTPQEVGEDRRKFKYKSLLLLNIISVLKIIMIIYIYLFSVIQSKVTESPLTSAFDRLAVQTLKQPTPQYTCYD